MSEAYTLATVHDKIASIYEWFHITAPFVTPQETGELGSLWALADALADEAKVGMSDEEVRAEFGVNA